MTHLDHDRQGPVWRQWVKELSPGHTLARYDERGCGLSDRQFDGTPRLDTHVGDLGAVADASITLFGMSARFVMTPPDTRKRRPARARSRLLLVDEGSSVWDGGRCTARCRVGGRRQRSRGIAD
jgi:hypothetical protein